MKIQVLGSGCPTCKKLFELTKEAVFELQLNAEVEYINDISKIIEMGVMSSPVLAIDGEPVMVGFVPTFQKIKHIISTGKTVKIKSSKCSCGGKC
jgi:small redox-active disulfide protein 2